MLRNVFWLLSLETTQAAIRDALVDLRKYLLAVTRLSYDSSNQLRVVWSVAITSGTVTTVTTVGTVTNTWLWGLGVNNTSILLSQVAFSNSIRNRIS